MEARLYSHNSSNNSGYTKRYQPWEVIYTEVFEIKSEAMKREKELKSARGRTFIRNIILKL
jgi:putative endonuclease